VKKGAAFSFKDESGSAGGGCGWFLDEIDEKLDENDLTTDENGPDR
jgi:hypothetical protein